VRWYSGWVLVPLMRVWNAVVDRGLADLPRPMDEPRVRTSGTLPDRILLFDRGPAMGWGVLSHELALSGSLARAVTNRTGRAADVAVVADQSITVHSALPLLAEMALDDFDAIVITFGAKDATAMTSLRRWNRQMGALLSFLDAHGSLSASVFVLGIQPIRSIPVFDSRLGTVADRHARALNAATAQICSEHYGSAVQRTTVAGARSSRTRWPARWKPNGSARRCARRPSLRPVAAGDGFARSSHDARDAAEGGSDPRTPRPTGGDAEGLPRAEGVGFEPTRHFCPPVFKTGSIGRSDSPPT
jgi:hypothetical protein